jgi:hypothetical protein
MSNVERLINNPEIVKTAIGSLEIYELNLRQVQKIFKQVLSDLSSFDDWTKLEDIEFIKSLLLNEKTVDKVLAVLSICVDKPVADVERLGLISTMKIISAIKKKNDFQELRRLFLEVAPRGLRVSSVLQKVPSEKNQTKTPVA